jgi:Xaa-Pro aminopeptidase
MRKDIVIEKINQAVALLDEFNIDLWLIFVRESFTNSDPSMEMVVGSNCTWQSAFLISRNNDTTAIIGSLEKPHFEQAGIYNNVIGYVNSVKEPLLAYLQQHDPRVIAINYSIDSNLADGLTHGMYLTLESYLSGTPYFSRLTSSEKIISALRGRKSPSEIADMKTAIAHTLEIYNNVSGFIKAGKTEKEVAGFILDEVRKRGLELAWDPEHCPSVFSGPETAGAHSGPTDRIIEKGHVVNMDFGVKVNGYCSDLQRTWYILKDNETAPPPEVQKGFQVIHTAISKASETAMPGVRGYEVDATARDLIVNNGYEEYQHGLGHQVGRIVHDGGVGFYPRWERYGNLPMTPIEAGQVFTIEPRLTVDGCGVVTIEEMVQISEKGVIWLSDRQDEIFCIRS